MSEETSAAINRVHDYQTYLDGVAKLWKHEIRVCIYLINGPLGKTPAIMHENVWRTTQDLDIQGVKLHLPHLMTNTKMMQDYNEGCLQSMSKEVCVSVICDQLEMILPEVVVHHLIDGAPSEIIIGSVQSLKKWGVLNTADAGMKRCNSYQGKYTVTPGKKVFN